MNRVLLDTTALLAHYLDEPGAEQVHRSLQDADVEILICAVSVTEFARRLMALGESPVVARERALDYAGLCNSVVAVDTALAVRACEMTSGAPSCVPLVDSLIAAAAHLSDALLVHRDAHFAAVAALRQIEISS